MAAPVDIGEVFKGFVAAGFVPLTPYVEALSDIECKHIECGRTVHLRWNTVQQGKAGCRWCAGQAIDEVERDEVMRKAGYRAQV